MHRVTSVSTRRYPVLHVVFDDGFEGDLDLTEDIAAAPIFAALRDKSLFGKVALSDDGYRVGWKLDELGREIDFSSDGLRAMIETSLVRQAAARHRTSRHAAE
jgi:Protein of unknown function (DUF2442)